MLTFQYQGCTISVKHAVSKVNNRRTYLLHQARELIQAAAAGKTVALDEQERVVKVDGITAFKQEKSDLGGMFFGAFVHLQLP